MKAAKHCGETYSQVDQYQTPSIFKAFETWSAPTMPVYLNPLHFVIDTPLQESVEHLSRFFTMQTTVDLLKERPKKGTFTIRAFQGTTSCDVKMRFYIYTEQQTVVELNPRYGAELKILNNLLTAAKSFFGVQGDDSSNCVQQQSEQMADVSLAWGQSLDLSGFDDGDEPDVVPTKDDWCVLISNCAFPNQPEEFGAMAEVACSYGAEDLRELENLFSREFLDLCLLSPEAFAAAKLVRLMAQDPSMAEHLISKVDPASFPRGQDMVLREIMHAFMDAVNNAEHYPASVQENLKVKVERGLKDSRTPHERALFKLATRVVEDRRLTDGESFEHMELCA
eukprot:GEMP01019262.1.p1 GENE.GEMP01019262.1~~GEMP01019262.1.p1  ORF type:complete len:338 (+),score=56.54 GEMP01019262.1:675-1688(+)